MTTPSEHIKIERLIRDCLGENARPAFKRWRILESCYGASGSGIYYGPLTELLSDIYSPEADPNDSCHISKAFGDIQSIIKLLEAAQLKSTSHKPIHKPVMRITEDRYSVGKWVAFVPVGTDGLYEDLRRISLFLRRPSPGITKYESRNDTLFELYLLIYLSTSHRELLDTHTVRSRISELIGCPEIRQRFYARDWRAIPPLLLSGDLKLSPFDAFTRAEALLTVSERVDFLSDFSTDILNVPDALGRDNMLNCIETALAECGPFDREHSFYTVAGGPGTGKSMLMRQILKRRREQHKQDACFLISALAAGENALSFCPRHPGERTRPRRVLEDLSSSIRRLCSGRLGPITSRSDGEAADIFQTSLNEAAKQKSNTAIFIFIDGLDETEDNPYGEMGLARRLQQLTVPSNVRFVVASRPTQDFRNLIPKSFDVDLDDPETQDSALREYFADMISQLKKQDIDIRALVRKADRSFLYAVLVNREFRNDPNYNINNAPAGLPEQLDIEWERATGPPLEPAKASRLMAIIAAHAGTPTISELCDISDLEQVEIVRFLGMHEHLFNLHHGTHPPTIHAKTQIAGYWHTEIQQHFEAKVGPLGMRKAHKSIAEWMLTCHNASTIAESTDVFSSLLVHLRKAEDWSRICTLVLSPKTIQSLTSTLEGKTVIPWVCVQAQLAAAKVSDLSATVTAYVLFMDKKRVPLFPLVSLWMRLGQRDQAYRLFHHLPEADKRMELRRLRYMVTLGLVKQDDVQGLSVPISIEPPYELFLHIPIILSVIPPHEFVRSPYSLEDLDPRYILRFIKVLCGPRGSKTDDYVLAFAHALGYTPSGRDVTRFLLQFRPDMAASVFLNDPTTWLNAFAPDEAALIGPWLDNCDLQRVFSKFNGHEVLPTPMTRLIALYRAAPRKICASGPSLEDTHFSVDFLNEAAFELLTVRDFLQHLADARLDDPCPSGKQRFHRVGRQRKVRIRRRYPGCICR